MHLRKTGMGWQERAQSPIYQRQRRSRIDWFALVPHRLAMAQVRYERHKTVEAMLAAGFIKAEIARWFKLSPTSIMYMEKRLMRGAFAGPSPMEQYCNRAIFAGLTPIERHMWLGTSSPHWKEEKNTKQARLRQKIVRAKFELQSLRDRLKDIESI